MPARQIRPLNRSTPPTTVELVEAGGLRRVLRLSGSIQATVELDLRNERRQLLLVDGEPVHQSSPLLGYLTVFPFDLPSYRGRVPATLEVDAQLWHAIRALRLRLRGQVVYSEGQFAGADPGAALPIPAEEWAEGIVGLPAPAMPLSTAPECLPLAAGPTLDAPSLLLRRQQWRRASTLAMLVLMVGGLGAGTGWVLRMREQQLYGPVGPPPLAVTSRPRHRPGPYGPAADPTTEQLRRR